MYCLKSCCRTDAARTKHTRLAKKEDGEGASETYDGKMRKKTEMDVNDDEDGAEESRPKSDDEDEEEQDENKGREQQ